MYTQEIKIPKERVGVLIGVDGKIKKKIEKKANVKLDINSEQGDVTITSEDNLMAYEVKIIIQAIGRGFTPQEAFQLFNEQNVFELVDITSYTGKSKKKMERLKGRVIGESGKSRKTIEDLSETSIVIFGKTIGIIGEAERASLARRAIEMLLDGAPHAP
ncbi:MAG: KH domain-containing protein, partial [Nanoarchaeota archaeon]|nr:KH domain-containing protein [Nanoarchaeota archaeon]MCG2720386.1 KH domain-containing protein [Nanoarchaeota archaeon]